MIVRTNENNPNGLKLIIAAKLADEAFNVKLVSPNENLVTRLPILELACSTSLFSWTAALQYLIPSSPEIDISVSNWLEWDSTQLQPALVSSGSSAGPNIWQKPQLRCLLKKLNAALQDKKYLITNKDDLTSADLSIWSTLWCSITEGAISQELSKDFPNIFKWLSDIEKLKVIQESLAEFKMERGPKAINGIQAVSWFPQNSYTGGKPNELLSTDASPLKEKECEAVSKEEIETARKNWSIVSETIVKEPSYPVLPKKDERNILITSALPYVNNVPHLGNIIGCVLSADIFARYCRQRNYNALYISGTDEYGTATEAKALEEKTTPQEICDKFFGIHNDIYRWFGIGFDYFGRTTTMEQTEIVQAFFLRIKSEGYILTETVDQLLCETCQRFLADRFVEGICPRCKYEDARGDQCDGCGHLVNATELIMPRCKVCNNKPVIKASAQFFLDLPKLEPKLREWASNVEKGWSPVARAVAKPWLRDGLKPRCITRDLKWGIPVPLDGYRDKVFYVWFDAPLGYISITKRYTKDYELWWKPKDAKVSLYQFMAKDNVPFHAIMFPASLLAADEGHTLVKHIMAIEYLNYEDTKFSKSRGIGVFGTDARETGIPADVWRFYLAYIRPESQDSNFNWVDLATKNNSELLNNFGNFVNRALMFAEKNFDSKVPEMSPREEDLTFLALVQRELTLYIAALEQAKLRDGLRHMLAISKHGNQYMQSQQPWVRIKSSDDDKKVAGTVIGICANIACLLSALLGPFMPNTSRQLRTQLGLDKSSYGYVPDSVSIILRSGHAMGKPSPLFTKIEDSQVESLRNKYAGKQDPNGTATESKVSGSSGDIGALEDAIAKQGLLVRDLKAKQEKSVWQPEVQILLQLKKQLADLKSSSSESQAAPIKKRESATDSLPNSEAKGDVAELEAAIAKQGLVVRELKAKEPKNVWQPQVEILLKLKKQLSDLGGGPSTASTDEKKSKKKK